MKIVVVGLGNIGSFLVALLVRFPLIRELSLIDLDSYDRANLRVQAIGPEDIGEPKARALAARARKLTGDSLAVTGIHADLRHVPLGVFRAANLVIGCLDGKADRVALSELCWQAGVPLLDVGLNPEEGLTRLSWFAPGSESACYGCVAGSNGASSAKQSCLPGRAEPEPTNAPAYLGAIAAALAVEAVAQFSSTQDEPAISSTEVILAVTGRRFLESNLPRNPSCGSDHRQWDIASLLQVGPGDLTVRQALQLDPAGDDEGAKAVLQVAGSPFVSSLVCPNPHCGKPYGVPLSLFDRLSVCARKCPLCRTPGVWTAATRVERLSQSSVEPGALDRPLAALGFLPGDVFAVSGPAGRRFFEFPLSPESVPLTAEGFRFLTIPSEA